MIKPANYENTKAGNYVPPSLGGHKMVIKGVKEQKSKAGQPMIVAAFDFATDDVQPNFFSEEFLNDVRPERKWPNNGTKYIMVNRYDFKSGNFTDECSKEFKAFCECAEQSNPGFSIDWDAADFGGQFKGKRIGGVFGVVENEYNGKITKRHEIRWFCPTDRAAEQPIPREKLLKGAGTAPAVRPMSDADIPF